MKNLQTVFNELSDLKKEQKELKSSFRDALTHSKDYQEAEEGVKKAKIIREEAAAGVKADFGPELNRLEELKNHIAELNMQMADIALTQIMKGERVEINGQYEKVYEPVLTVKFKKKD